MSHHAGEGNLQALTDEDMAAEMMLPTGHRSTAEFSAAKAKTQSNELYNLAISHLAFFDFWNSIVSSEHLAQNPSRTRQLLSYFRKLKSWPLSGNVKKFEGVKTLFAKFPADKKIDLPEPLTVNMDEVLDAIKNGYADVYSDPALADRLFQSLKSYYQSLGKLELRTKIYGVLNVNPSTGEVPLPEADAEAVVKTSDLIQMVNTYNQMEFFKGEVDMRFLTPPPPHLFARPIKEEIISDMMKKNWCYQYTPALVVIDDTEEFWDHCRTYALSTYDAGDPRPERDDPIRFKLWCEVGGYTFHVKCH
jgi:hypothetical protein